MEHKPGSEGKRSGPGEGINNLNFLIILLDKGFPPCYKLKSFNAKEVGDLHIMSFLLKTILKEKKEDGMKKLVIVAIAVLLAMPVLSHAAAVNNKWDMTIGGFIWTAMGIADQELGSGFKSANRRTGVYENPTDENSNFIAEGDVRLNFIVRGPDAMGAKTMGRAEFDFIGANRNESSGTARLRHAYLQFDWAKDSILFGQTSYGWQDIMVGPPPGVGTLSALPGGFFVVSRDPQIRWTHKWVKDFRTFFGVEYPGLNTWYGATGLNGATTDQYTRSTWPNLYAAAIYQSDLCGRIGMNNMIAGVSGVYGRQSIQRAANTFGRRAVSNKQADGWAAQAFFQIPIIPEKNQNKAGALLVYANFGAGQGLSGYSAGTFKATTLRPRPNIDTDNYETPLGVAWQAGMMIYLTDSIYLAPYATDQMSKVSSRWRNNNFGSPAPIRTSMYSLALMYAPNPAVTIGLEYFRTFNKFNTPGYVGNVQAYKNYGVANAVRIGALYYF
jgi:hypothetical protein